MSNLPEIWRAVPGYEGYYEVSSYGRIRSLDRVVKHGSYGNDAHTKQLKGRELTPTVGSHGYASVMLSTRGVATRRLIHDLVTEVFLGTRVPGQVVNHRDLNRLNNAIGNLEYVTQGENVRHAIRGGARSSRIADLALGIVEAYDRGVSASDVAIRYSVSAWTVRNIVYGRAYADVTGRPVVDGRRLRWLQPGAKDR